MGLTQGLTLEEVSGNFANWRMTKKPGDRIPHELWQQVKCAAVEHQWTL